MNTKEYFEKRALQTEKHSKDRGEKYLDELKKSYEDIEKQIQNDISKWYKKYADTDESISNINARKPLKHEELKEYLEEIKNRIENSNLSDEDKQKLKQGYLSSKLNRLESLLKQTELNLKILTKDYENSSKEHLAENYKQSYSEAAHSLYDCPTVDFDLTFDRFDNRAIEQIVNTKWSNKDFSERIWVHYSNMASDLQGILNVGIALGYSVDKMSRQIRDRMDVNFSNAKRLIRTESNYILSEATQRLYENVGLEKYQFLATLDFRTSEICQSLDGKVFEVSRRQIGLNCNPMHPNCRSTTIPYLEEYQDEGDTRLARDMDGKNYKVPANMDYKAWYESMSENKKDVILPTEGNLNEHKVTKKAKAQEKYTQEEVDKATEWYVSGNGQWINQYLRGNSDIIPTKEELELIDAIKQGTNSETVKENVLYRSVDAKVIFGNMTDVEYNQLKSALVYNADDKFSLATKEKFLKNINKKELLEKGFMSTTKSKEVALEWREFTGSDKPVVLELKVPEGIRGRDLEKFDIYGDKQFEVLLSPNQKYVISEVTTKQGAIYVKAELKKPVDEVGKTLNIPDIKNATLKKSFEDLEDILSRKSKNSLHATKMSMYLEYTEYEEDTSLKVPYSYFINQDKIKYNTKHHNFYKYDFIEAQIHEISHRMDMLEYKSSENTKFLKAIKNSKKIYQKNEEKIIKWFDGKNGLYSKEGSVSDIISVLTKGKANSYLLLGHEKEYWKDAQNIPLEIFANLSYIDIIDKEQHSEFKSVFKDLIEAYLEVVS